MIVSAARLPRVDCRVLPMILKILARFFLFFGAGYDWVPRMKIPAGF